MVNVYRLKALLKAEIMEEVQPQVDALNKRIDELTINPKKEVTNGRSEEKRGSTKNSSK